MARIDLARLEAFLTSAGLVAIAEIGDKTQLLALMLAARFRRPIPIVLGILCATLLNHAAAATVGLLIASWLSGETFQLLVGVAFLAMAAWALVPDKADDGASAARGAGGVFLTTVVAFFLVEIGDKTQIATTLLAARFEAVWAVTAGTTLGMMVANAPVVFLGDALLRRVSLAAVRIGAAAVFALIGAWIILTVLLR